MKILPFYQPVPSVRPLAFGHSPVLSDPLFSGGRADDFTRSSKSLDRQMSNFSSWVDEKRARIEKGLEPALADWEFYAPPLPRAVKPQGVRASENQQTLTLFKKTFPTFLWTGIECSNPLNLNGERWDELAMADFYNPESRRQQIHMMHGLGIRNVRLGMPNHKIVKHGNWKSFGRMLQDFKDSGSKISLDLQHFGLPDSLKNDLRPERSLYLNPEWPEHFVRFATATVRRYADQLDAITIINEPLITNNFSGLHWNEGVPGSLEHPEFNRYFIERALLLGEAAVTARFQIEKILQEKGQRKIFIHNESCEYRPEDPDFNQYRRFLSSDLILGQDWLLRPDYTETPMFKWLESQYVRPVVHKGDERQAEFDRARLVARLERIRERHLEFEKAFGKTMKADTVFGIDFYATCEGGNGISGRVEDYAAELKAGKRRGLAGLGQDYYARYQLPILHTETNMANDLSSKWGMQQLIELAQLQKSGIPVLGFTWYSLMDQFGWDKGLSGSPEEANRNHIGLVSTRDNDLRRFAREILPDLRHGLEFRTYPKGNGS